MTISVREQALFVRQETTFGTYLAPAGTDVVQVSALKPNPAENLRWIDREIIRGSLNPEQGVYGGALFGFEFDVELKGSGAAGTAPRYGRLLRACGLQETIVASTSVTYRPLSTLASHEGVSIGYRAGGVYRTVRGCRGTFSLTAGAGQTGKLSFKMVGHINSEADAAAPTPTFETTRPPPFLSAAFAVGGFTTPIAELTLDVSNTVSISPDPNSADGYGDVRVTARKSAGKFNPEAKLIATKDWVGLFRAGTSQAIATGVIGPTAGNRWALNVPLAYFMNVPFGDREELLTHEIEFGAAESAALDDDWSLQLT
jgi:hypothetical protein